MQKIKMGDGTIPIKEYFDGKFDDIEKKLDKAINDQNKYVTKVEFEPIKKVVYGLVSVVLTSVVLGLLGLIILNAN